MPQPKITKSRGHPPVVPATSTPGVVPTTTATAAIPPGAEPQTRGGIRTQPRGGAPVPATLGTNQPPQGFFFPPYASHSPCSWIVVEGGPIYRSRIVSAAPGVAAIPIHAPAGTAQPSQSIPLQPLQPQPSNAPSETTSAAARRTRGYFFLSFFRKNKGKSIMNSPLSFYLSLK